MSDGTKIEWAEASVNPIRARNRETGKVGWFCTHASDGCVHCYSEAFNRRLGTGVDYRAQDVGRVEIFLDEEILCQPLRWERPRRIFWNSMTDMFGEFVPDGWLDKMFGVMALTPHHVHLMLTKRTARLRDYVLSRTRADGCLDDRIVSAAPQGRCRDGRRYHWDLPPWPLPSVWAGGSVEDQRRANERIPEILATPAAVHWVSAEPLLEGVDLAPTGGGLDWVVIGGESGEGARPFNIEWARRLIHQCRISGTAVFYKQGGASNSCRHDSKGGHFECFPEDLKIREYPRVS